MSIDSPDYQVLDDLALILTAEKSLTDLDSLIAATSNYKLSLEKEILSDLESPAETKDLGDNAPDLSFFTDACDSIGKTGKLAENTQNAISALIKDISYLDVAKRNLTQTMSLFENLKMLADSYFECEGCLRNQDFKQMCSPYEVMSGLARSFGACKSEDNIGRLLASIARLQNDTYTEIKKRFKNLLDAKGISVAASDETVYRDGICRILDSSETQKREIIDICVSKLLQDIGEIFQIDDEAGSLENVERRYVYFKKVASNFTNHYAKFFPASWDISMKLTARFYAMTRSDLSQLLNREVRESPSLDVFMSALQATVEFEKYVDVKFANRLHSETDIEKISACFEPHLTLWISHQNGLLNNKMMQYMRDDKLPPSMDSLIIPSSADLFRTYRGLLGQVLELIESESARNKILSELAQFFAKWVSMYVTKILRPLILPPGAKIQDKQEAIIYTDLVINTADYCSTTIDQLIEKLHEYFTQPFDAETVFDAPKSALGNVISSELAFLLNSIVEPDLKFIWREFTNTNWEKITVEDYSRYMVTLKTVLVEDSSPIRKIDSHFNRDVYNWVFLDKVINLVIDEYLRQVIDLLRPSKPFGVLTKERSLQPIQVINASEQLLLDLKLLEQSFYNLIDQVSTRINAQGASYKRVRRHIDDRLKSFTSFLKILVIPTDLPATYNENYMALTNNNNSIVAWCFMLALKGTPWDLALWKTLFRSFKESVQEDSDQGLGILANYDSAINEFVDGLRTIQTPVWRRFVEEDLSLKPAPSSPPLTSPTSPTQRHNLINNNFKQLMSNKGFFNRRS
ncbi:LAMI_0F12046g1_1 [Lachancea mirantina]|uniref:LAMI_0F12046g1_1 n=1 Tax=Lachancea mirantina TaxID=1230905 RepID=A0A1G4K2P7_9SACH|nr:LAMI_0F12046g1_1 [Lachancea mirantina]